MKYNVGDKVEPTQKGLSYIHGPVDAHSYMRLGTPTGPGVITDATGPYIMIQYPGVNYDGINGKGLCFEVDEFTVVTPAEERQFVGEHRATSAGDSISVECKESETKVSISTFYGGKDHVYLLDEQVLGLYNDLGYILKKRGLL